MDRPILKWTSNSFELQTHMNLGLSIPKLNFKLVLKAIIESRPKTESVEPIPLEIRNPRTFDSTFFLKIFFFRRGILILSFHVLHWIQNWKQQHMAIFFCSFSKCGRGWIFLWQVLWNPRQLASRQKKS